LLTLKFNHYNPNCYYFSGTGLPGQRAIKPVLFHQINHMNFEMCCKQQYVLALHDCDNAAVYYILTMFLFWYIQQLYITICHLCVSPLYFVCYRSFDGWSWGVASRYTLPWHGSGSRVAGRLDSQGRLRWQQSVFPVRYVYEMWLEPALQLGTGIWCDKI